jgi:flagellum-specific ATP synthase
MRNVVSPEHFKQSMRVREAMAIYRESEDLINIGAYKSGTSAKIDQAIRLEQPISNMLKQPVEVNSNFEEAEQMLMGLD